MNEPHHVVVVGACHAGFTIATSLRQAGFSGRVSLVDSEESLPYQRPPLSKGFLLGKTNEQMPSFRPESFYRDKQIDLVLGEQVTGIDRANSKIVLGSGARLGYEHLVLATGARARTLPVPGAELDGVVALRNLSQSNDLRQRLDRANVLVVVGGGFIGLEVASAAAELGVKTAVVEAMPRIMTRVVSEPISTFFASEHARRGVHLTTHSTISRIVGARGQVRAVELADGTRLPADVVVAGVGVTPNVELADETALRTADGIEVDQRLWTSDESISAIGDCALFPHAGELVRLESVQNATDQARCLAAQLAGSDCTYTAVPWFWSDQAESKLQIAGLARDADQLVVRGDPDAAKFSVMRFRNGELHATESVNRPADHMAVRRLLDRGIPLTPEQAEDPMFDLKSYARTA